MSKDESAFFFLFKSHMIQTRCGSSSREIILPITQVQNILLLTLSLTNQTILSILPFQALTHIPIGPDFYQSCNIHYPGELPCGDSEDRADYVVSDSRHFFFQVSAKTAFLERVGSRPLQQQQMAKC